MTQLSTFSDVLTQARELSASDIHFGTFSGLQFRIAGTLLSAPETSPHLLSQLQDPREGAANLVGELLNLLRCHGRDDTQAILNEKVATRLEGVVKGIASNPDQIEIEDVLRLGRLGIWRLTLYRSDLQGIGLALRALPNSIPGLDQLIPAPLKPIQDHLIEAMKRTRGLFLTTGATGSGKSSTLAALLGLINATQQRMAITLEDPVEYWHTSNQSVIRHRQIGVDVPTFSAGLKGALRQDPDVILVGELRDLETIALAITAAETGHLVLGTLHSRDVRSALTRIVDVFPAGQQPMIRAQLADSLIGVMSQRLEPIPGEHAKRVLHPELAILPDQPGGVRATIHDGRFHQIISGLETMNAAQGAAYYSFDKTAQALLRAGLIAAS